MSKLKATHKDRYSLLKPFSKENRHFATEAELYMWEHLRRDNLGVRFRRQHPIGDYIVDFVCIRKNLIIEIDGGYHNILEQKENDEIRTTWLNKNGYNVIRFSNEEILMNIETVLNKIKNNL